MNSPRQGRDSNRPVFEPERRAGSYAPAREVGFTDKEENPVVPGKTAGLQNLSLLKEDLGKRNFRVRVPKEDLQYE